METIRVIIIDEQPLFREGIRATLKRMGDCVIIGESTDAAEVFEIARTGSPDVAIIDAGLASSDPLEIACRLRHLAPHIALIFLASSEDEESLFQALKVGVAAYYSRHISPDELMDAVRKVSHGDSLISQDVLSKPAIVRRMLASLRDASKINVGSSPLSPREVEILDCIARGNKNKEIARSLKMSNQMVKKDVTSILNKLAVNNRTSAVVYALRHGWMTLPEDY